MKFSFNLNKLSKVDVLIYDDCYSNLDIPKNLSELGVENPDIDRITEIAMRDPSVAGNPRVMTVDNTKELIETLF